MAPAAGLGAVGFVVFVWLLPRQALLQLRRWAACLAPCSCSEYQWEEGRECVCSNGHGVPSFYRFDEGTVEHGRSSSEVVALGATVVGIGGGRFSEVRRRSWAWLEGMGRRLLFGTQRGYRGARRQWRRLWVLRGNRALSGSILGRRRSPWRDMGALGCLIEQGQSVH